MIESMSMIEKQVRYERLKQARKDLDGVSAMVSEIKFDTDDDEIAAVAGNAELAVVDAWIAVQGLLAVVAVPKSPRLSLVPPPQLSFDDLPG